MNLGRLFFGFVLIATPTVAQINMEQVFQKDNPNIVLQNEAHRFDGSPLVYLEGTSDKIQPKTWEDKLKIKLFGSMEIPKTTGPELDTTPTVSITPNQNTVQIKPAFGPTKQVAFIPHTPDWHFVITATDTNAFNIHEELTFILKEDTEEIERDWPIESKNFQLTQLRLDGQVPPYQLRTDETVSIVFSDLKTGVHKIQLDYLIIPPNQELILPFIGSKWPFIADTFSGVIFQNQNSLDLQNFLIGTNNQSFPENFDVSKDKKGNIFFKMNKILPPKTQIQLQLKSDQPIVETVLKKSFTGAFVAILMVLLFVYVLASALEIKYMSLEKKLKKFAHIPCNSFVAFLSRNKEILIGCLLLILLSFLFSMLYQIQVPFYFIPCFIVFAILIIFGADRVLIYPNQQEIIKIRQLQQERNL